MLLLSAGLSSKLICDRLNKVLRKWGKQTKRLRENLQTRTLFTSRLAHDGWPSLATSWRKLATHIIHCFLYAADPNSECPGWPAAAASLLRPSGAGEEEDGAPEWGSEALPPRNIDGPVYRRQCPSKSCFKSKKD